MKSLKSDRKKLKCSQLNLAMKERGTTYQMFVHFFILYFQIFLSLFATFNKNEMHLLTTQMMHTIKERKKLLVFTSWSIKVILQDDLQRIIFDNKFHIKGRWFISWFCCFWKRCQYEALGISSQSQFVRFQNKLMPKSNIWKS